MVRKIAKPKGRGKIPTKKIAITDNNTKEVVREVEIPISENREIQDGVPPRLSLSQKPVPGYAIVGNSLGVTLNMGDYQSARVDVFIQRAVKDDNDSIMESLEEISEMLIEEIERQSELLD